MARHESGSRYAVELEQQECGECGVVHGVPVHLAESRRERGGTITCPNGHPTRYPPAVAEQPPAQPARAATGKGRRPPGRLKDTEKHALAFIAGRPDGATMEELAQHMGNAEWAQAARKGLRERRLIHGQGGKWKATKHGRELVPAPGEQAAPMAH